MTVRHFRLAEYRRMPWKNGGGWTTQLAASGGDGGGMAFDWRISIAEIESDGAFSLFAGCERLIALLDGQGMRLDFDESTSILLDQRLRFARFSGDWHAFGTLLDGPVRDFNVIARSDRYAVDALHRPLVGTMLFPVEVGVIWFVYLVAGDAQVTFGTTTLDIAAGESLLLEPGATHGNRVLRGAGELVVVRLGRTGEATQEEGVPAESSGLQRSHYRVPPYEQQNQHGRADTAENQLLHAASARPKQ